MKENKLIAEFMGYPNIANDEDKKDYLEDCVKYHESWDWLMPVVEKIESIDEEGFSYSIQVEYHSAVIWEHSDLQDSIRMIRVSGSNRFDATYNAVVEFIKQYNEENESND